jgi:hypothetical protein
MVKDTVQSLRDAQYNVLYNTCISLTQLNPGPNIQRINSSVPDRNEKTCKIVTSGIPTCTGGDNAVRIQNNFYCLKPEPAAESTRTMTISDSTNGNKLGKGGGVYKDTSSWSIDGKKWDGTIN